MIYLDHNSTTPIVPEVLEAMLPFLTEHQAHAASAHAGGQRSRAAVNQAREQVAELIGCKQNEILFTGSGTESNNLAIHGVACAEPDRRHLVTTSVEHAAILQPCRRLESQGYALDVVPVDALGRVDTSKAESCIGEQTLLVSVMHANNEVGTIQPVAEVAGFAHTHNAWMHCDAAQSVGKLAVNVNDLQVDLLSIAGHKLYAPKGVGALFVREGTPLAPFMLGANHERGLRPGTENVPSIVGLGAACVLARHKLVQSVEKMSALRDELYERLAAEVPGLRRFGDPAHSLPNTLNVGFPDVHGRTLLMKAKQVAASTGAACHSHSDVPSSVLTAMGVDPDHQRGMVRMSLGRHTTHAEIVEASTRLIHAWNQRVAG
jgi:cysteine desulfurase